VIAGKKAAMGPAQLRLRAIQSQLDAAFTYCSTAETALTVLGRVENARRAIEKARRAAELVQAHVNEPNHVPADSVDRINERLTELDTRVSSIEARLPQRRQTEAGDR